MCKWYTSCSFEKKRISTIAERDGKTVRGTSSSYRRSWLLRGKVLDWILIIKDHVYNFLNEKMLPEERQKLKDRSWLNDLAFLADISRQLNMLKKRIQGKQQLVSHLSDRVNSFWQKLLLFRHQLNERCFEYFSALKDRVGEPGSKLYVAFYVNKLDMINDDWKLRGTV